MPSRHLNSGRRGRSRGFRLGGADGVDRELRDLLLDLLDDARVADLAAPVGVHEPAALLRAPAARVVVGLGARDVLQLGLLLAADVAPVLAAGLETAARRRRDEVGREAFDREELPLPVLVETRNGTEEAP